MPCGLRAGPTGAPARQSSSRSSPRRTSAAPKPRPVAPLLSAQAAAVQARSPPGRPAGDPREQALLEDVRSFYAARDFRCSGSAATPTPGMTALRRHMDRADEHGLDPAPYARHLSGRKPPAIRSASPTADVEFSRAVARFVTHLASGRISRPMSAASSRSSRKPPGRRCADSLSDAADIAAALARYEPPHPQYSGAEGEALGTLGEPDRRPDRHCRRARF